MILERVRDTIVFPGLGSEIAATVVPPSAFQRAVEYTDAPAASSSACHSVRLRPVAAASFGSLIFWAETAAMA